MQLFTQEELQALVGLFSRTPMSPAEQQFVMTMMNRLVAYCQPPKPPEPKEAHPGAAMSYADAQAMADGVAMADALDKMDKEEDDNQRDV